MSSKSSVGDEGDRVECIQCTCIAPTLRTQEDEVENHLNEKHLKNWEKWISERKRMQRHLAKSLNRSAGDLLMMSEEGHRQIQEERIIFEYCKVNTYFDKYRGNPAFWKVPAGLSEKQNGSNNPVYFANLTKIERNEIPIIEHIATPNYIIKEKSSFPCNRNLYPARQHEEYKNIPDISSKVNKLIPHRPECDDLIVVGKRVSAQDKRRRIKENIDFSSLEEQDLSSTEDGQLPPELLSNETSNIPKICFHVNETVISDYNQLQFSVSKIRLIFECTTNLKAPEVKYLKFKNEGLTTVRFYWHLIKKFLLFRDLIKCSGEESHSFFFDKNELLLPPAETIYFPIWFKCNKIGNYFEMWEITTKPEMWSDEFKLIVYLQAFVYPDNFYSKSKYINEILDKRVANTVSRNVLNDILQHLKFTETDTEVFSFTEKQLFESVNQEIFGVEKRPKYAYDKYALTQLKLLYKEVKLPYSPKFWNYCIKDLRILARKKDIWMYVENETKEMMRRKQRRMELEGTVQETTENTILTEKEPESEEIKETYCQQLHNILQKLERPSMVANNERLKYFIVYSVIRSMLFKMCDALEKCDNPTSCISDDCYPTFNYKIANTIEQMPDRLIFERFDDIWIDRAKRRPSRGTADFALPKPDALHNIPMDNSRLVYQTYFKLADIESKPTKNKVESKTDDMDKLVKEQEKTVKSRDVLNTDQSCIMIKEAFDPFEEEYLPTTIYETSTINSTAEYFPCSISFNYNKYLVIFTYLSEAIEAMVDALETFKENELEAEVLGELTKCADLNLVQLLSSKNEDYVKDEDSKLEDAPTLKYDPYFRYLLDSHLNKNLHTKEYIVEGRRKMSREENVVTIDYKETSVSESLDSWIFKSHQSIMESEIKPTASAAVQTSEAGDSYKDLTNLQSEPNFQHENIDACEKQSHDIFYFMDDEEEVVLKEKKYLQ